MGYFDECDRLKLQKQKKYGEYVEALNLKDLRASYFS